jgi:hypothetical protein
VPSPIRLNLILANILSLKLSLYHPLPTAYDQDRDGNVILTLRLTQSLYCDGSGGGDGAGSTLKVRPRYVTTWQCGTTSRCWIAMVLQGGWIRRGYTTEAIRAWTSLRCCNTVARRYTPSYDSICALVPWLHIPSPKSCVKLTELCISHQRSQIFPIRLHRK